MNVDAEINAYLSKLSEPEKILMLDLIKKLNDITSNVSIAEKILIYNNELEEAVQKIKNGDFIDHNTILKEADEW
jgi:hypothetical protein